MPPSNEYCKVAVGVTLALIVTSAAVPTHDACVAFEITGIPFTKNEPFIVLEQVVVVLVIRTETV